MSSMHEKNAERKPTAAEARPTPVPAEVAKIADPILEAKTKTNRELLVEKVAFAIDPKLRSDAGFTVPKKLVLAEVLNLIADSLDPEKQAQLRDEKKLLRSRKAVQRAMQLGVVQTLKKLRPLETLANQLILWKSNSSNPEFSDDPAEPDFRESQVSIIIGPNSMIDETFRKIVRLELKRTNKKIARGLYRSFMLIPLDRLKGGSMSLIPYLRMAKDLHFHIVGNLGVADNLDDLNRILESWKFSLNDVSKKEQDILSNVSVVLNDLKVRPAHYEIGETEPLTCGAHYAFGAQMTKYFHRKKDGHWYIPILQEGKSTADIETVNQVSVLDDWQRSVANHFNYNYYVSTKEDSKDAGCRIYGGTTMFPVTPEMAEQMGNQIIPKTQSQARVTRNRIYFYLATQLERWIGGQIEARDVKKEINRYLNDLQAKGQIYGFEIVTCEPDSTGANFKVTINIHWLATAESFEIDTSSAELRE